MVSANNHQNSKYFPALDGLRAVSILLVVISHAGFRESVPGGLGVIFFFVISGFLLTSHMAQEISTTGTLRLGNFYLRRVLRLAPALITYVTLSGVVLSSMGVDIRPAHVASALLYFANYYHVYIQYSEHNPYPVLWSLAVEEHFYICFPILMIIYRHNLIKVTRLIACIILLVPFWRVYEHLHCNQSHLLLCNYTNAIMVYNNAILYRTDTIFDCILYGSLLALLMHYYRERVMQLLVNPGVLVFSLALLLSSLLYRSPFFRETFRYSLQSLACALIILNVLYGRGLMHRVRAILSGKLPVLIGRLSYSLYLFHFGTLMFVTLLLGVRSPRDTAGAMALYIGLSFALSFASYYFIERPMVALRVRYGSHSKEGNT